MLKERFDLLYSLNGSLVCAVHKRVAMSYRHGAQFKNLEKNQKVSLQSVIFPEKIVEAQVVDFSKNSDYVYFVANQDLVEYNPRRTIPTIGKPYNVIALFKGNPAVSSFGNIYSEDRSSRGHVRGTSPPLDGESGALVVSDFGEIIGISIGGCNRLEWKANNKVEEVLNKLTFSSRLGSHRLIVPVYVLDTFLADNYPEPEDPPVED
ncbi:hypothetical protein FO519_001052 [Halicephalobus sp. NKZ332]|nr:hypothetical protein FO519_001052 [Halicephalobus sp. NKZ332]